MNKEKLIEMGISEELADQILTAHAEEINTVTQERDTAVKKAEGLETQLITANDTIAKFGDTKPEELTGKIADWEKKYNEDTGTLKKQLEEQELGYQTEKFLGRYKFTSELAKGAALAAFREKGFKIENGKFLGGDEFMEGLKKSNPTAFDTGEGVPRVITNTSNGTGSIDGVEAAFYAKNPSIKA